jgi:hypothetical protein
METGSELSKTVRGYSHLGMSLSTCPYTTPPPRAVYVLLGGDFHRAENTPRRDGLELHLRHRGALLRGDKLRPLFPAHASFPEATAGARASDGAAGEFTRRRLPRDCSR